MLNSPSHGCFCKSDCEITIFFLTYAKNCMKIVRCIAKNLIKTLSAHPFSVTLWSKLHFEITHNVRIAFYILLAHT